MHSHSKKLKAAVKKMDRASLFDPEAQLPHEIGLADPIDYVDPQGVFAGIQGGQGEVPAESHAWRPSFADGDRDCEGWILGDHAFTGPQGHPEHHVRVPRGIAP